jgi:hypothetical protein
MKKPATPKGKLRPLDSSVVLGVEGSIKMTDRRTWKEMAWLDLFGSKWFLLNADFRSHSRSWADERVALEELKEEGWIIANPYRNRLLSRRKPSQRISGYAMMRTVH